MPRKKVFRFPDDKTKPLPKSGLHRIPPQSQPAAVIMSSDSKRDTCASVLAEYKNCLLVTPVKSNLELIERGESYFKFCAERRLFPTIEGLASYLGYGVRTLLAWQNGERSGFSDGEQDTAEIIERLKGAIDALDGDLVMRGEIPPIPWIFRRKAVSGWVEAQKIQIETARKEESQPLTADQIARMLPDPDQNYSLEG